MSEHDQPVFPESDVPLREFGYPDGVEHLVYAQFGLQARAEGHGPQFASQMKALFGVEDGPIRVERCHGWDAKGFHEDIMMAYWLNLDTFERWIKSPDVVAWWDDLPEQGEVGYWREIMTPDVGRVNFAGFGLQADRLVGCTHAMRAVPSDKWGYWGGYRDRFDVTSSGDQLASDIGDELPPPVHQDTFGRRVSVAAPNNICFVREGVVSTFISSPVERAMWEAEVEPALDKWVQYLIDNPALSGALSTRRTVEQDLETGEDLEKYSILCYFLTLRHLERAARTQPSHLALYNTFSGLMEQFAAEGIVPELQTWVDQHVLPRGALRLDYVNCHPQSGFLGFFQADEAASVVGSEIGAVTA
ncbi:phenylacetaldoxime dehydratase family protein [Nocardioides endophyticus]|uniref:Phenylacetaldoxime dehydratase family protein n=1 Tax=Nocardioides endophyticus TaxID=1353775 RepID=A0ABP8Y5C0_9ACTN